MRAVNRVANHQAALFVALGALWMFATPLQAQQRSRCELLESESVEQREEGPYLMAYVQGPLHVRCDRGEQLRANYAEINQTLSEVRLVGNVWFQDPDRTLTSREATYNATIGRLFATGDAVFTNRKEGSSLRGPEIEYYRAIADTPGREAPQVNAFQRPHLTLRPRDAASDAEPLEIDADRVSISGADNLSAYGTVEIRRSDLDARAQEAQYEGARETLDLRRDARITSENFDLRGDVVQAWLDDGSPERVEARRGARLTGEDLEVTAPELRLWFREGAVERAVGIGGARGFEISGDSAQAIALSPNFELSADSLDAAVPGQTLDRIVAIGRARGEAEDTATAESAPMAPDSLGSPTPTTGDFPAAAAPDTSATARAARDLVARNWIVGDTIIGEFERRAAPADTAVAANGAPADTAETVLRRITARGLAQSLYRLRQQGGGYGINYIAGEGIVLEFEAGELATADVTGLRHGLYLDRNARPERRPSAQTPASPVPQPGGGR